MLQSRFEPALSPNPPARIPEALTPSVTSGKAPASERVSAVRESARPRVEMARRPVQAIKLALAPRRPRGVAPVDDPLLDPQLCLFAMGRFLQVVFRLTT